MTPRSKHQRRDGTPFDSRVEVAAKVKQDSFLDINRFLVGSDIDMPRNGACSGKDSRMFFPAFANGRYSKEQLQNASGAIQICKGCPIRAKCLIYSLEYEPHGIWGGFPETTRALLAIYWGIVNKRRWTVRHSFLRYRKLIDYIISPEDISFVKKVADDNNFTQPPFDERFGLSPTAERRISQGMALRVGGQNWHEDSDWTTRPLR